MCHHRSDRGLSASARHAAQQAALLAQASGRALTLTHTVGGSARGSAPLAGRRQSILQCYRGRCAPTPAGTGGRAGSVHGVNVDTHLSIGNPVEQVVRHADDVDAGLLVTGTAGAGFFRGVVFGSTAERIASDRHGRCSWCVSCPRALSPNPGAGGLLRVEPQRDRAGPADRARGLAGPDACRRAAVRGQDAHARRGRRRRDALPGHRAAQAQQRLRGLAVDAGWTRNVCA